MQSSKKHLVLFAASFISTLAIAQTSAGPVVANVAPSAATFGQQIDTVEELLQIDSKIALEKAREKALKSAPPVPVQVASVAPISAPDEFEVISILGVSGNKSAVLSINGKNYYRLTPGTSAAGYSVVAVGDGCVEVVKGVVKPKASRSKSKAMKSIATKRVCFDMQAEHEAALTAATGGAATGYSGTPNSLPTRMTLAPLPLPTIPAVVPPAGR